MTMKLRIEDYSFGRMIIDGREFRADLIIHPDGHIQGNWWRAQGHNLVPADIAPVLAAAPEKLIIGTGASGVMRVSASVLVQCEERGIQVDAGRTAQAVERFNKEAAAGTIVAGCFHLTC
jgi:hypothetical protein